MSDLTPSTGPSGDHRLLKGRSRFWARMFLFLTLAGVLTYVGIAAQRTMQDKEIVRQSNEHTMASAGISVRGPKTLSPSFTDKQVRLLADPPTSPDEWINPDPLVVAHIEGADETPGSSWAQFEANLAKATGKKVVDQTYGNSADEVAEVAAGKVTLLALHPADAPLLVNQSGFQPVAVLGDESGFNGNRLDLIVPTGSSIVKPADIMGHKLVCTVPSSITGYRAAIAFLMKNEGLRPNVDYEIIWSTGQTHSITGIAEKKYEVAAVSDDKLQSLLAKGTIKASQYKVIYQSQVIPRTTIGYFYNLNPTLADQIHKAILSTSTTTAPAPASDQLTFLPVDYKRDFQFVRDIDDQFDPRFDAQASRNKGND